MLLQQPVPDATGISIARQTRLDSLDVLRGLALCGVFITHFICKFYGLAFTPVNVEASIVTPFDPVLDKLLAFILFDKPRGMFSFLFGVGFFYQLSKMTGQSFSFKTTFIKRLVILFLFGVIHFNFFFEGDVLRYYGIIGVLLLICYRMKPVLLLMTAFLFSIVLPCVCNFFPNHLFLGSFNTPALLAIFGQFLFGYWAARQRIFENLSLHRLDIKRVFWCSLSLNLSFAMTRVFMHQAASNQWIVISAGVEKALALTFVIGIQVMIFAYISGILLLYMDGRWKKTCKIFIPAGRMTLTNYIAQSLIAIAFFKLGIYERLGTFASFSVSIALCVLQLYSSKWWLMYFKSGPLEWLWRSLAAMNWQPEQRAPVLNPDSKTNNNEQEQTVLEPAFKHGLAS